MTSTQTRQGGQKHILIARPAAVFAEDVTDAYVAFEVHSENGNVGTAQTPRFTGQPAKMVREWKGEYKIPVTGEVTSLDIKLFGKVAGDRVAPEGEDLLVASGYLDSRDMKAFYGFHRVLLQFGNHSVKWEVTFVIQPGQGTTSSMSRSISQMSRASSAGLSERLGSLGLTLDNTSVYSESGLPQSPSARSIASSRPPPSQSGYSKSGYPPRGPQSPINPPASSPPAGNGAGNAPRNTEYTPNGSPFSGQSPNNAPNNERTSPNAAPNNERTSPSQGGSPQAGATQTKPMQSSGSGDRNALPAGAPRDEPTRASSGSRGGSPTGSGDRPRTAESPNAMPGMMHKPTIKLPSPASSVHSPQTPSLGKNLLSQGPINGPSRSASQTGPASNGSYKLAGSGYTPPGQAGNGYGPTGESAGPGGYGPGSAGNNVMDIKVLTRPGGSAGHPNDGMDHIGSSNSRVPSRGYGSVSRNVQKSGAACQMCSAEYFTIREDRPVVREVTDYILEHHLFEREYVRQVRYRGEHEVVNTNAAVEVIKADERIMAVSQPADPCLALANPARSPADELRALAQSSKLEGGISTPRSGSTLTHVREGTLGARTSPGANSLKTSMDRIGTSPFASQNGVAQTGVTQAAAGQVATVSTTVTTKIEPPPRPQAELCKQEVFRQIEDRPVLKQRTRFMREHHIFEKTYVREVKYAGEVEVLSQQAPELVRTEERIVEVTQPGNPCACIRDGLNLDRLSQGPGGFSAGANNLMTTGHTYSAQGVGMGGNCAGGACKPGAGAYSQYAQSSEGMASGKFSSTFPDRTGPLHTFQNSGNFPRKPLQQSINRQGIITGANKGYMG